MEEGTYLHSLCFLILEFNSDKIYGTIQSLISPGAPELQEHSKSVCLPAALLRALHQAQISRVHTYHFLQICATLDNAIDPDPHPDFSVAPRKLGNWGLTLPAFSRELTPGPRFASSHLRADPAQRGYALLSPCACPDGCHLADPAHIYSPLRRAWQILLPPAAQTQTLCGAGWLPGFSQLERSPPIVDIPTWMHNQLSLQRSSIRLSKQSCPTCYHFSNFLDRVASLLL